MSNICLSMVLYSVSVFNPIAKYFGWISKLLYPVMLLHNSSILSLSTPFSFGVPLGVLMVVNLYDGSIQCVLVSSDLWPRSIPLYPYLSQTLEFVINSSR